MSSSDLATGPSAFLEVAGQQYPPQLTPRGRGEVTRLLLDEAGVAPDLAATVADKILAAVNLMGPHLCSCLHVDGGSDPAKGHGYYQCDTCGGLCCSERWCGHEVMGLVWMESVMQQNRHGHIVVKGLNWLSGRLKMAIEKIAQTVPREHQKLAVLQAIDEGLAALSDIWHQQSLGHDLYDARGQEERLYEQSTETLGRKLHALKAGTSQEAFLSEFQTPVLTPAAYLDRKLQRAQGEPRKALEAHHEDLDDWATAWLRSRGFRVEREPVEAPVRA